MNSFIQDLSECTETADVGGKGANLGKLVRAGFPVPPGFVITTHAYRAAQESLGSVTVPHTIPQTIADAIRQAYRALGAPPVAVRSSATAEDMVAASMAGQYETFLDVRGEEQLLEKVTACWASLDSPRIRAYLREHEIDPSQVAMGVVVQALIPADVAGVLFTSSPRGERSGRIEMMIEASWGLGESVVSGSVQPDVFHIDAETGKIVERVIADKRTMLAPGSHASRQVEETRRKQASLNEQDIQKLWQLGVRAREHFGKPQDIEWAIHAGELFILQSRPITTHADAEAQQKVLAAAREQLRARLAAGHGPWVPHNLGETLAHPTPLTWSVIKHFMSGAGGLGKMYRQAGFAPSPRVDADGFLDLIAGRIYMDVSRAPEMFFEDFPFAYDLDALKGNPEASQSPPTVPRGSLRARMAAGRKLAAAGAKLRKLSENMDRQLRDDVIPQFSAYVRRSRQRNLQVLTNAELIELWKEREQRVLGEFGGDSLLPSLISGMAVSDLRTFLAEHLWREDADGLAQTLSASGPASRTMTSDDELYGVAKGERPLESWLAEHGHRGPGEFDLAAPRWREQPEALLALAARLSGGERPLDRHRRSAAEIERRVTDIRGQLPVDAVPEFERHLSLARRYMPFREDGKDYLMAGYELLRDLALEAGRRLGIGNDVFQLTRDELFSALQGSPISSDLLETRKVSYRAEERLTLPRVLDAAAIESLGSPAPAIPSAGGHRGFAVSAGRAAGPAKILLSPTQGAGVAFEKGYVLVCPSTDPSWTPLFVNAGALILECGGSLSHGAVVAREMGLSAVVIPGATRLFKDGEEIVVDGNHGWAGHAAEQRSVADPDDTVVAGNIIPPVAGPKDRRAGKISQYCALLWTAFIAAFFILPSAWVHNPTLDFIDLFLWPVARGLGKPWTVVVIAAVIASVTLLLQKVLTDNDRLLEAKRRGAALLKEASTFPLNSPRRKALQTRAAPVQVRTLLAALVPVGILLGPMLLPFVWFKNRIDPSAWSASPGSPVQLVAFVDADHRSPVSIHPPPDVSLDDSTPAAQTLPPIRATLEHLLSIYNSPDAAQSWELKAGPNIPPEAAAADLKAYLATGIPPQPLRWRLIPPPNFSGKFDVTVSTEKATIPITISLGDASPPRPPLVTGIPPIRELRAVYAPSSTEKIFWRPFAFLGGSGIPWAGRLAAWDAGWIWLYIGAYIPILFALRALLKVA